MWQFPENKIIIAILMRTHVSPYFVTMSKIRLNEFNGFRAKFYLSRIKSPSSISRT